MVSACVSKPLQNLQRTAGYVASSQRQTDGVKNKLLFTAAGGPLVASITPLPPGLWFCTLVRLDFGQRMMAARLYQKSNAGTLKITVLQFNLEKIRRTNKKKS